MRVAAVMLTLLPAGSTSAPAPTASPAGLVVIGTDVRLSQAGGQVLLAGRPLDGTVIDLAWGGAVPGDVATAPWLQSATRYRQGRRHGVARQWYADGTTASERRFRDGVKVGRHRGFWPDGAPRFEQTFDDGRLEGTLRTWHMSGTPAEQRHYLAGVEVGPQRIWEADGRLRSNYVVRDGRRYGLLGSRPCATVQAGVS